MKILIVNGSRKNGNTHLLAQALVKDIQTLEPVECQEIHLCDLSMGFCSSCHACFANNESICKDSVSVRTITDAFDHADLLIVASPVYALQVSGLVKNWMDHFAFIMHRPRYFTKRAVIVTSTAGAGTGAVVKYLKQILPMWGFNKVYSLTATLFGETLTLNEKLQRRIAKQASKIVDDFKQNKYHSPSMYHLSIHTVFRVMNHLYSPNHIERLHWEMNDLSNPVYPAPTKLGLLKTIYGKVFFRIMIGTLSKKQFP